MVNENLVREIVTRVVSEMRSSSDITIPVEVSARHVHLSQAHVETLFGKGHQLTPKRELSQPGQFLCEERVRLVGEKGVFENVAVLGPVRDSTQVELSATDARQIGVRAPLRISGDLQDAGDVMITAQGRFVQAVASVIVAKNHIHMTLDDARRYGVRNGQWVNVRIESERPVTFENVTVRVDARCTLAMHIDFDEANACLHTKAAVGILSCAEAGE